MNPALFSSSKSDWQTPPELFEPLHERFNFVADMAANHTNHLLPVWYGPGGVEEDALAAVWPAGNVWCNPPYGAVQKAFIWHAVGSQFTGTTTVMLLPARTDTKVFHEWIWDQRTAHPHSGVEVHFLKGRLTFVGAPGPAPFPSMIVIFHALTG